VEWLRQYVAIEEEPEALAHRLTMAGLTVDGVERPAALPDSVVIGKIVSIAPHPQADRLHVCMVDAGDGETIQVVCGAPNAREGLVSAFARVGTLLPNGVKLRKAKIRGVESRGMLCSEIELGVGEDAAGILELEEAPPGTPLAEVLGGGAIRLDIDVPSNRGDCLSHIGVAREVAALTSRSLRLPAVRLSAEGVPATEAFRVTVESLEDCPRFTAHVIRDVKVGPSPPWLVQRLEEAGSRSINNVVDVTNFVMLETGQPLHSFDMDRLGTGRIHVRRARSGETLTTLDDVERRLDPEVLLITDGERPIAAAGVMGGANTEVVPETTQILLEAACFQPLRVLRGSRALRLDTDASLRFRRGVDPVRVDEAARRAAALLAEVAGGTVAPGRVEVVDPAALAPRNVSLRPRRVEEILGEEIGYEEIESRLTSFGFSVQRTNPESWTVGVPSWRRDVFEECDLAEEVGRHRGYDTIGLRMYNAAAVSAPLQPEEELRGRIRSVLGGLGFREAVTRNLVDPESARRIGLPPERIETDFLPLLDPPSREEQGLRLSLLPSLLDVLARNVRHGTPEARLFEIGKSFRRRPPEPGSDREPFPDEEEWVALGAIGGDFHPSLERAGRSLDFLEFKGFVETFLSAFRIDAPKWRSYTGLDLIPPGSVEVTAGESSLGFACEVNEATRSAWDLARPVFLAQLRFASLPRDEGTPVAYREPSRFPAVRRDLALVVPEEETQGAVRSRIAAKAGTHLESIELFDHYRGKHIPPGHIGLGFSLTFRALDRTLEEAEVDRTVDALVQDLKRAGIERREG